MGHSSRDCPKRTKPPCKGSNMFAAKPYKQGQRTARQEATPPVLTAQPMIEGDEIWSEVDVLLASWSRGDGRANLIAKLARRGKQDVDADDIDEAEDEENAVEARACHAPVCGALDSGCGMALIGSETLSEHEKVAVLQPEWEEDAPTVRFKSYGGKIRRGQKAFWINWRIPRAKKRVETLVYAIEGKARLLISKQAMKMLQANLELGENRLWHGRLQASVPAREAEGSGRYEVDLLGREFERSPDPDATVDDARVRIGGRGMRDLGSFEKVTGRGACAPAGARELVGSPLPGIGIALPRWTQIYLARLIKKMLSGLSKASAIHHAGEEVRKSAVTDADRFDAADAGDPTERSDSSDGSREVSISISLPRACGVSGDEEAPILAVTETEVSSRKEALMVAFAANPRTVRRLLQSLTDAETARPELVSCVAATRKMMIKVPAGVTDSGLRSNRRMKATLSYHNSSSYVQVLRPAAIEDTIVSQIIELERSYYDNIESGSTCKVEMPSGIEHLRPVMRFPPREADGQGTMVSSVNKEEKVGFIKLERPTLPKEGPSYQEASACTACSVIGNMSNYPDQRDALLRIRRETFGLDMIALEGPGTPLRAAVQGRATDFVQALLKARADANESDDKGVSLLHVAAFDGAPELCGALLEAGACANAKDRHGQTPLFFAPSGEVCELLHKYGAACDQTNQKGQLALHLAGRAGLSDVLAWLAQPGHMPEPMLEQKDVHGATAAYYAHHAGVPKEFLMRHRLLSLESPESPERRGGSRGAAPGGLQRLPQLPEVEDEDAESPPGTARRLRPSIGGEPGPQAAEEEDARQQQLRHRAAVRIQAAARAALGRWHPRVGAGRPAEVPLLTLPVPGGPSEEGSSSSLPSD
ncbi:unnamed protein product [Prorocentrum cordatum]|uniref:Uncharacterized protein n=1 Tax=Prorocentrum cordatum TaxID=2364126 RepID=A0ABN9TKU6_9DINO|nr:unnamed protein product [Polarella glacialis]